MQRLRSSRLLLSNSDPFSLLRKRSRSSWLAVQDTFFSTKDIFERRRVVFTVGTSLASVATAWFGYSLRHLHESRVDQRLESIEKAMKDSHLSEHAEIEKIVKNSGGLSVPACIATAGTTLFIGYGLGWRGGRWYANRQFKREQMKLLGQLKPKRWQVLGRVNTRALQLKLPFIRRPLARSKSVADSAAKASEKMEDVSITNVCGSVRNSC